MFYFMATEKKRINVSLSTRAYKALSYLARRDDIPYATKAAHLIDEALELEEDIALDHLAHQRDTEKVKYIPHNTVWGRYGI